MNRLLWLFLACVTALSASAGAGYLVVIGPAPLRFEGRVRPAHRALALLPPLVMQEPVPPAPPTNTVALTTTNDPPPAPVAPPAPVLPIVTTLSITNPPVVLLPGLLPTGLLPTGPLLGPLFDPNDPNSFLTAQMLIHYFRPLGTNTPAASVLGPLFIPPRPASLPPSSTVRYTTP